ncbi:MAG: hypothetical protein VBE63_25725 [Lamprobacter sp.]|uniref:hypothetical protein n=1 Tax=Lamprobacter sp. TaxID=3100796 RepID=UPI002B2598F7|nr:hypothetical protein [Lamprobacter sp.]MEA3643309.1 hypothetical protein [Lamprobacter sp.]
MQPMRVPWRLALIVLGMALCAGAWAQETWTLSDFYDARNAIRVRIAAVKNAQGDQFKLHAASNASRVWVTFLPATTAPALDSTAMLSWWCSDAGPRLRRDVVTQQLAQRSGEPPSSLYHAGAHYLSFVLEHANGLDGPKWAGRANRSDRGAASLQEQARSGLSRCRWWVCRDDVRAGRRSGHDR